MGIAIALAGIAIVWLIIWTMRNEKASSIADQKGLFRMVDHEAKDGWEAKEDRAGKE